ncbi:MAG TPA: membrane protein insertion efficiency factor YidD [Ignavibacteria bacterium]|nr:membrane protein insertion efficiency factor YidD [Ignavibacteria bacterium]
MINKNVIVIIFLFPLLLFGQVETNKWQTHKIDYQLSVPQKKEYILNTANLSTVVISSAQIVYYSLFSEYDGDNCPFHPSCSAFFVEAVERTNILQGSLMFADRFTRDMNFFKGYHSYSIHSTGKFFDPVYNYELLPTKNLVELKKSENE